MANKVKRMLWWATGGVSLLLILFFLSLVFFSNWFMNWAPVRSEILSNVSQRIEGTVNYKRLALQVFPYPHVLVYQGSLIVPAKAEATVESVAVYPKILPLFTGKVQIGELRIDSLKATLYLAEKPSKRGFVPAAPSFPDIRQGVSAFLSLLAKKTPDLRLLVNNSALELKEGEGAVLSFRQIEGRVEFPPQKLECQLSCASNLWNALSLRGRLNPETLNGEGEVHLSGLQPQAVSHYLPIPSSYQIGSAKLNLDFQLSAEGLKRFRGELRGALPQLLLSPGGVRRLIRGGTFGGTFDIRETRVEAFLTHAEFDYPKLALAGHFLWDRNLPSAEITLDAKDAGIASIRDVALVLAGRYRTTHEIFKRLKGGEVPHVVISAKGKEVSQLRELENISVQGRIRGGEVFIPELDLQIQDVASEATMSKGVLEGKKLYARRGNIRAREGNFSVGLRGKHPPLYVDTPVEADLSQVPALLAKVLKNDQALMRELTKIEQVEGRATGRLHLEGPLNDLDVRTLVSDFDVRGRYRPIPYPVEARGGRFSYEGGASRIAMSGVSGSIGKTAVADLTGSLILKKPAELNISSLKSTADLDQIYPWLMGYESLRTGVKYLKSIEGSVLLQTFSLKGPLYRPKDWRFKATGGMQKLTVGVSFLPAPVKVKRGGFEATPQGLRFSDADLEVLDASLKASGFLFGVPGALREFKGTVEGRMGAQALEWIASLGRMPSELQLRPPIQVEQMKLDWTMEGTVSLEGRFTRESGPEVALDMTLKPSSTTIKEVRIRDESSVASFSLASGGRRFSFGFHGDLHKKTLDKLLMENRYLGGWIKGDCSAVILLDRPVESSIHGWLEGRDLLYPWRPNAPVEIERLNVKAEGKNVRLESTRLSLLETGVDLKGDVSFSSKGFLASVDLTADRLEWGEIETIFFRRGRTTSDGKAEKRWAPLKALPFIARFHLKANAFDFKGFTWRPVEAYVAYDGDNVTIDIVEADLCGISTPGMVILTPKGMSLNFSPAAENEKVKPAADCLFGKRRIMTGSFELNGEFSGFGKPQDLLQALEGRAKFKAKNGRIYELNLLSKIFAVLNLTEIFRGKLPDLVKEGFAYKTVEVEGAFSGGKLKLEEASIDGSSMGIVGRGTLDLIDKTMDLTILVAPLKTVDVIIKYIPPLKYIFKGHVLSIPVKVSGNMKDPEVFPLSPSAVGSELLNMIKRILLLPVKIIQPLLPDGKDEK